MKYWLLSVYICVLSISLTAQCLSDRYTRPVFSNVTTTSGIQFGSATAYGGLIPQNLYLDLYEPTGDTLSSRPLIVYAFGGGFLIGTRIDPPIPTYASYFAKCGYVVASIDYRIGFNVLDTQSAERAVYRGVQDLRGAVRFLCQHYPQYRIDTSEIFLTGSSAGCFSGLHSTFVEQSDWPSCIHGTFLEPADLGCVDCDVNTDNNRRMPQIKGILNHWGAILDTIYIRPIAKDNVPTISVHGDQDNIVPYNVGPPFSLPIFPSVYGSAPITRRLTDLGVKSQLVTLSGYGHEPWLLAPQLLDTCYKYEVPFLYSILKPRPLTISGDSTLCVGVSGTYTVPQRNGSHYCWTYSGGTRVSGTNNSVTIQWSSAGLHLVTAREMTRDDVNGDLDSFFVNVLNYPVAAFGDSVLHTSVQFHDSSTGASSWTYDFGDGGHLSAQNPTHVYHNESSYVVRLIVSNGYCADTAYRTIHTDTCPVANIHYTISHDTLYVSADTSNGVSFIWTFGDGGADTGVTGYHVYNHSQNYLLGLTVTSAKACTVSGSTIVAYQEPLGIAQVCDRHYAIYPNPAHGTIRADCSDCIIAIYDCLGRLVLSKYELNTSIIDISGLDTGIYNIFITADGQTTKGRLIIQ